VLVQDTLPERYQEFLQQLATYDQRHQQFAQSVRRFQHWLITYRTSIEQYLECAQRRQVKAVSALSSWQESVPAPNADPVTSSDVTDAQWELVASLVTIPQRRGRPYVDARRTLNGIRFVLATGCGWNHMPDRYGNYVTCWRRLLRWQTKGIWAQIQHLLERPDALHQHSVPHAERVTQPVGSGA
jgi:transposase